MKMLLYFYRFSPEAKQERNQFSYLPFGLGPRRCIGMRLGLMETKLAMVTLIQKFKFKDGGVSKITQSIWCCTSSVFEVNDWRQRGCWDSFVFRIHLLLRNSADRPLHYRVVCVLRTKFTCTV